MAATLNTSISTNENKKVQGQKIQIYSTPNDEVSSFWRGKYEKDAKKYWDIFYKRHQDKFFKDRHYLDKEWGHHFSGGERKVLLEVGCGAGNTIFPLLATYPDIYAHACDFSTRAVNLVKMHKDFTEARVNAFVCDLTIDDLCQHIAPSSVDIVTMIFVLSAVSPEKMPFVVNNVRKILKPNGRILFRDYATGDLAQERFTGKEQKISENFYVRGDGTRAFYFSEEFLGNLFVENGYSVQEHVVCCKQVENRSREIIMNRRWVQAVFQTADQNCTLSEAANMEKKHPEDNYDKTKGVVNGSEIDMSVMALELFGIESSCEELGNILDSCVHDNGLMSMAAGHGDYENILVCGQDQKIVEVAVKDFRFKIKVLSKEYQHTCTSTGLMLWESATLMASILATNQHIISGKRVLELGSGCTGICSMIAAKSADLVVATDGDTKAIDLLTDNVKLNLNSHSAVNVKELKWGDEYDILGIKQLNENGFDVIIGTDVTYVVEAIVPLFETAKELISSEKKKNPALILCHVFRRVDEPYILSVASQYGFVLVDRWHDGIGGQSSGGIISSWFSEPQYEGPTSALNIMYFQIA